MPQLPCFEAFVDNLRDIWRSHADDATRMGLAREILSDLAGNPALLAHSKNWPHTVGQNLLLHEDDTYGFVVNAVVRPPGYKGGVHDHAHAWVLYGVVDGVESLERYRRLDKGDIPGHAELELISAKRGTCGTADVVPPFDIHAEQGGAQRSVALIVRSQRLVGKVLQNHFDLKTKTVTQGSGPQQVPYVLIA